MRIILITFFLSISLIQAIGQDSLLFKPISPIAHPMLLSGSYGELRSNHFHSGIDIKSSVWNKSGDKIRAVEKGYVSRIKVKGDGYGKALYIDHPGGMTSVYGHLNNYSEEIEDYILSQQFHKKSFELDLYPDKELFKVEQGEIIGAMGNTGRSAAPHLHFEIRNTKSERPINPYRYNLGPEDNRAPSINRIKVVHFLPDSTEVNSNELHTAYISKGNYKLSSDTIEINAWRVGIEVNGFDRMNGASNKNGIYELEMKLNGQLSYHYIMDSFSFDESMHLNAHINYPDFHERKARFQRCYVLKGDPLSIYTDSLPGSTVIKLFKDKKQHIEIIARDFAGNESRLEFWLKRKSNMKAPPPLHYNYVLKSGEAHLLKIDSNILYFPDSALYQKSYLHILYDDAIEKPLASPLLIIKNQKNIFKNSIDLYLFKNHIADSLLNKACIVSCKSTEMTSYGGDIFEDFITTKIPTFGNYAIYIDSIAPEIKAIIFPSVLHTKKEIILEISDNLKVRGRAKKLKYNAYLNGSWVPFEYDAKTAFLKYIPGNKVGKGKHHLKIEVMDDRNNIAIFEKKFTIK